MYPLPKTIKSWISLIAFFRWANIHQQKISDSGRPSSRAEKTRFRPRRAYLRNERFQLRPDGSIPRLSELIPDLRDQLMPGGSF